MATAMRPLVHDHPTDVILEIILFTVLAGSVLFFGAVYPWISMTAAAVLFLTALLRVSVFSVFFQFSSNLQKISGLFLIFLFVHTFFISINPYESFFQLLHWLAYLVLFLILQKLNPEVLKRLLFGLVMVGAATAVYGLWEVFSGQERVLWKVKSDYAGFVTGTYINRNHFAGFLELMLGVGCGFFLKYLSQKRLLKAVAMSFLCLVMLLALFKSGSRMGSFSFLAAFFAGFLLLLRGKKKFRVIFSVPLLIALGFLLVTAGSGSLVMKRLEDVGGVSFLGRWSVWQDTLMMLKDYWFQGIGLGNFRWLFPFYQSAQNPLAWEHTHNDYLELLVTLGLPMFLAMMTFLGLALFRAFSDLFKTNAESENFFLRWGMLVALASFLSHGLADFNFAIPANAMLFMAILSAALVFSPARISGDALS